MDFLKILVIRLALSFGLGIAVYSIVSKLYIRVVDPIRLKFCIYNKTSVFTIKLLYLQLKFCIFN